MATEKSHIEAAAPNLATSRQGRGTRRVCSRKCAEDTSAYIKSERSQGHYGMPAALRRKAEWLTFQFMF